MTALAPASWQRGVRAVAFALFSAALTDATCAQLPVGSYFLQDPVRGILGVATSWDTYGGGHTLVVEWLGPLGDSNIVVLAWDWMTQMYRGEMYVEYYFRNWVVEGVATYGLVRQNGAGGFTLVSEGTIE